jgi:hypothetical protein
VGTSGTESIHNTMDDQTKNKTPKTLGSNSKPTKLNNAKRSFIDVDPDSSDSEASASWPRFLLIQAADLNKPLKLSPFAIQKGIQGLAGTPKNVSKLRSGDLLVEVSSKNHSDALLRSKIFVNIPINVSAHKTLNTKKGVVRSRDLLDCDEAEIVENLRHQGVTEAKRIIITRNGAKVRTGTLILTFALPSLPSHIKCGYLNIPVDLYIPNPLRCFKCQQFGHHRANCKRDAACAKCGSKEHDDSSCKAPLLCVNCKGAHASFSRDCPQWEFEKSIQTHKTKSNLSYPEAKRAVEATRSDGATYAAVVHLPRAKISCGCQTKTSWLFADAPFEVVEPPRSSTSKTPVPSTTKGTSTNDADSITRHIQSNVPKSVPTPNVQTTRPKTLNQPKAKDPGQQKPKDQGQTKGKLKKTKAVIESDRQQKGNRFFHLRNDELELAVHASDDGDLDDMDVVQETPPNHNQISVR